MTESLQKARQITSWGPFQSQKLSSLLMVLRASPPKGSNRDTEHFLWNTISPLSLPHRTNVLVFYVQCHMNDNKLRDKQNCPRKPEGTVAIVTHQHGEATGRLPGSLSSGLCLNPGGRSPGAHLPNPCPSPSTLSTPAPSPLSPH